MAGLRDALKSASGGRRSTQATRIRNQAAANMVPKSDVTHEVPARTALGRLHFASSIHLVRRYSCLTFWLYVQIWLYKLSSAIAIVFSMSFHGLGSLKTV